VERLKRFIDFSPPGSVEVHLVGHSAGSVFLGALLNRLIEHRIPVDSLQLLGAALTTREFSEAVVPRLGKGLNRFTVFNLSEKREQDDRCPGGPITLYFKSLLYFVARSLEQLPGPTVRQTPMVGMETALNEPMSAADPRRLGEIVDASRIVVSPTPTGATEPPADSRSHAIGHGDLDNDVDTLTSVLLRILRSTVVDATRQYQAHAPSATDAVGRVGSGARPAAAAHDGSGNGTAASTEDVPVPGPVAATPPGPVKAREKSPADKAPDRDAESPTPAPTSIDYADMLTEDGWKIVAAPAKGRRRAKSHV
jgi:hypothetical protein